MDPSILSEEEELQPLSARYNSYPAPKNISPNINQIILFTITKSRFTLGSRGHSAALMVALGESAALENRRLWGSGGSNEGFGSMTVALT